MDAKEPVHVCRGLRGDATLALAVTAFLSSRATTALRATCAAATTLFVRHAPVNHLYSDLAFELRAPHFGLKPRLWPSSGRNPMSPLKCFRLRWTSILQFAETSRADCELGRLASKLLCDRSFVLNGVRRSARVFEYVSPKLRADADVALIAVSKNWQMIKFVGADLRRNRTIAECAVRGNHQAFHYVDPALRDDYSFVSMILPVNRFLVEDVGPTLRANADFLLGVARQGWPHLKYAVFFKVADEALWTQESFARAAIAEYPYTLSLCRSRPVLEDRSLALSIVAKDGRLLRYMEYFQDDEAVVRRAVEETSCALAFASPALKRDRALVTAVAAKSGWQALLNCDKALRSDREIVLCAVATTGLALTFADEALKADRHVVEAAVRQDPEALRCVHPDMKRQLLDECEWIRAC